ncbi:MAG: hypothetical protein K6C36_07530, partial [Clostridia bacterium]|nr:hypothetical protein [Clostridia bacterium]
EDHIRYHHQSGAQGDLRRKEPFRPLTKIDPPREPRKGLPVSFSLESNVKKTYDTRDGRRAGQKSLVCGENGGFLTKTG